VFVRVVSCFIKRYIKTRHCAIHGINANTTSLIRMLKIFYYLFTSATLGVISTASCMTLDIYEQRNNIFDASKIYF